MTLESGSLSHSAKIYVHKTWAAARLLAKNIVGLLEVEYHLWKLGKLPQRACSSEPKGDHKSRRLQNSNVRDKSWELQPPLSNFGCVRRRDLPQKYIWKGPGRARRTIATLVNPAHSLISTYIILVVLLASLIARASPSSFLRL